MVYTRPTAQDHVFFLLGLGKTRGSNSGLHLEQGLWGREPLAGAGSQEGTVMLNLDRI